ncbi:tRNA uridine-5-carboxymethylaminomethyl(34) synthesis GTPase MnmE [Candidatus Omnitrophota bacterium]
MAKIRLDDTIVAISTPIGEGGIGIVRLSGKDALKIVDEIFLSADGKKPSDFRTYTVHYGHIIDKGSRKTNSKGRRIVDEVILTVMRAPKSYTKEDVVEINCHSGIVPLKKILELVLMKGARFAEPGEFTKRAFLNGRIDILQAESVADIIRAKTDLSLRAAVNNLEGSFSRKIKDIRSELLWALAHIEASIDFSEEEDADDVRRRDVFNRLKQAKKDIERLVATSYKGKILRQGIKTVICGSPNVGKSSLMNAMLKDARAIVTHLPGTTRDTIEEIVNIKGVPVVLVDTAGVTKANHPAEKEGVKRSHFSMQRADLILLVLDYGRKLNRNDLKLMHSIKDKENIIIVINKKDLKRRIDLTAVKKFFPKTRLAHVSAINFSGINKLENTIRDVVFKGSVPTTDCPTVSNDRQLAILRASLEDIEAALASYKDKMSVDCIGVCVRSSIESLGEVTGHNITEEALGRIFSEFCVGK